MQRTTKQRSGLADWCLEHPGTAAFAWLLAIAGMVALAPVLAAFALGSLATRVVCVPMLLAVAAATVLAPVALAVLQLGAAVAGAGRWSSALRWLLLAALALAAAAAAWTRIADWHAVWEQG